MTQNNIILDKPDVGIVEKYTISEGDSARINFEPSEIESYTIGDNGELIISFADAGQIHITNFEEFIEDGNLLYLADGTLIDPTGTLNNIQTAAGDSTSSTDSAAGSNIINKPGANTSQEVTVESGQKYVCNFDPSQATVETNENGQMVMTFSDGSQIIINNYTEVAGETPAELTLADGNVIDTEALLTTVTDIQAPIEDMLEVASTEPEFDASQLNNIETAAGGEDIAAQLNQIETAAGEGGAGATGHGYGFGSQAVDVPLDSPNAIGPLGATQLAYTAPQLGPNRFTFEDDRPEIVPVSVGVDESNLVSGTVTTTGNFPVNFGNDAQGATITTNGQSSYSCSVDNGVLASSGVPIEIIAVPGGGYEGYANGILVFDFSIENNGNFTYNQYEQIDHADASDPDDILCLHFGVTATDGSGDRASTFIRVEVKDDAPTILSQAATIVDETNAIGGLLTATGQFEADLGQDVTNGAYTVNDTFTATGSVDNGVLTSNGSLVTVVFDAGTNTYIGTDANSNPVFTLELDPDNGSYEYTQFAPLDHADDNNPDDVLFLNFGVDVTDFDGDTVSGQITIQVFDDAPTVNDAVSSVDETGGTDTVTGSINIDFGNDGAGSVTPSDSFTTGGSLAGGTLTSGGEIVDVVLTPNGYVGTANGIPVFEIQIDPTNGDYTFTQFAPLDHADGANPDDIITLNFGLNVSDFEGDTVPANITISVLDDAPIINNISSAVDESDFTATGTTVSGALNIDGGLDGVQSIGPSTGTNNFTPGGSLTGGQLTSGGVAVLVVSTATGFVGTANGQPVFTLDINPQTGEYTYVQSAPLDHADGANPDDVITLGFEVSVTDNDGDIANATITINVADDGPTANDDLNTFDVTTGSTNGNVITGQNGGPAAADDLSVDDTNTVTQVEAPDGTIYTVPTDGSTVEVQGEFGVLAIESDGSYTYVLDPNVVGGPGGTGALDPVAADVSGFQTSIMNDGITISSDGGQDLSWLTTTNVGSGIGITGGGTDKVFGAGEQLNIDLADGANTIAITLADLGTNNVGDNFAMDVYLASDPTTPLRVDFTIGNNADGTETFTINAANYGPNAEIIGVDLVGGVSYLLANVEVNYAGVPVCDEFDYTLQDGDGDISVATLSLKGNPNPIGITGMGSVDETEFDAGGNTESGNIFVNFQGDTGITTASDSLDSRGSQANGALTSNGVAVNVVLTGNTYIGTANGTPVFEMTINDDATYDYAQFAPLDHADGANPNDAIQLDFGVLATDSDEDTGTGIVTITVYDDAPVISSKSQGANEIDLANGPIVITNTLPHDFGEDGSGAIEPNGTVMTLFKVGGANQTLTSGGQPVSITQTNDGYVGVVGNTTIFSLVLNAQTGEYTYTQFEPVDHPGEGVTGTDDVIWLKFGVTITDGDGDTDTAFIQIDIRDDAPEANNDTGRVGESKTISGNVLDNDEIGADDPGMVCSVQFADFIVIVPETGTTTVNGTYGVLTISASGAYSYTAHDNNPDGTDVFTYVMKDADGDTDTATLSILVEPEDDTPIVLTPDTRTVDETDLVDGNNIARGQIEVRFGTDSQGAEINPDGRFSTMGNDGGQLTSCGEPVVVTVIGNTYTGTAHGETIFTLNITDSGAYTFIQYDTLDHSDTSDHNDELLLKFGVEAVDGDGDKGTTDITIRVLDDGPEIATSVTGVNEINLRDNGGPLVVNKTFEHDFGQDGAGSFKVNGQTHAKFKVGGQDQTLQSDGKDIVITTIGNNGYVGKAGGVTVFTLSLNETTGEYTYKQFEAVDHPGTGKTGTDDVIWLKLGVSIMDKDGDTANAYVNIDIRDDAPEANNDTGRVGESKTISGNVLDNDEIGADDPGMVCSVQFADFIVIVPETGTTTVNGTYGVLTISASGAYSYTAHDNNPDGTDVFTYVMKDADGDTDTATLSILVEPEDDTPIVLTPDTRTVDETDLVDGNNIARGQIEVRFGTDSQGAEINPDGRFSTMGNDGGQLTSCGEPVVVTVIGNTYTGTAHGETIFTLNITDSGAYTFIQYDTLDHSDTSDHNDELLLKFGVEAVDGDGDKGTTDITIRVLDDGPEIATSVTGVNEINLRDNGGPLVVNKTFEHDFGQDGAGSFKVNGQTHAKFKVGGQDQTLQSDGKDIVITTIGNNGYVGKAGGVTVFTLSLNETTGEYTYKQFEAVDHPGTGKTGTDDVIWLKLGVSIMDKDGDTANAYVNIDIRDDAPVANNDKAYVEANIKSDLYCLDPISSDVQGTQNTITKDGITVSSNNGEDLTWVSNSDGSGIGINGAGSSKVYNPQEVLQVSFVSVVTAATFTLADMGANNIGDSFKYEVNLEDGTSKIEIITIEGSMVKNGMIEFDVSGYDAGITSVDLIGGPSFVLNNVKAENVTSEIGDATGNVLTNDEIGADDPGSVTAIKFGNTEYDVPANGIKVIQGEYGNLTINAQGEYTYVFTDTPSAGTLNDIFTYTITDADDDTSTAQLEICVKEPVCDVDAKNDAFTIYDVAATSWDADKGSTVLNNPHPDLNGWNPNYHQQKYFLADGVTVHEDTNTWNGGFWYDLPVLQNDTGNLTITSISLSGFLVNREARISDDGKSILFRVGPDGDPEGNPNFTYDVTNINYTVRDAYGCEDSATVKVSSWDATSPLVLDLDGDGIELLPIENGVNFDMDNDGSVEKTGWVGSDDGLLAYDSNGDGIINDKSELFGNSDSFTDGFSNLSSYDDNGDGMINSEDAIFNNLTVWQDTNSDGITNTGEAKTLDELGIQSISLNAQEQEGVFIEGSWVSHASTYETIDGQTHEIVDAWFDTQELPASDMYGTQGADQFLFQAIGEAATTIYDFNAAEGDGLDLSALLQGQDDVTNAIDEFVFTTQVGDDTVISVDVDGAGGAQAQQVAVLDNVTGISADDLLENGNISV